MLRPFCSQSRSSARVSPPSIREVTRRRRERKQHDSSIYLIFFSIVAFSGEGLPRFLLALAVGRLTAYRLPTASPTTCLPPSLIKMPILIPSPPLMDSLFRSCPPPRCSSSSSLSFRNGKRQKTRPENKTRNRLLVSRCILRLVSAHSCYFSPPLLPLYFVHSSASWRESSYQHLHAHAHHTPPSSLIQRLTDSSIEWSTSGLLAD